LLSAVNAGGLSLQSKLLSAKCMSELLPVLLHSWNWAQETSCHLQTDWSFPLGGKSLDASAQEPSELVALAPWKRRKLLRAPPEQTGGRFWRRSEASATF